jgi:myo-inositol 2-dehydrogenase / D-chiro-inositol 1-dehydrogenase
MKRFALFGAGRIGRIHAHNLRSNPQARLLHVCDVNAAAAAELAAACGASASTIEAALADRAVDAVVIASSTDTHAELIEASARAGKAILCEKPLDLDVARATRSLQAVERAGVLLAIGFNRRFDPSFAALQRRVAAGEIGAVECVTIISRDPAPPPVEYVARSGGLFRDMTIHDLDMGRWLLGEEIARVSAHGSCLVDAAIGRAGDIDSAVLVLETASGRLCHITNSRRCSYGYDQRIEVFGSAGMLRAGNQRATSVERAGEGGFQRDPVLHFFLERYAAAYRDELQAFVDVQHGQAAPLVSGLDGLRALQLADAAQQALRSGAAVKPEWS